VLPSSPTVTPAKCWQQPVVNRAAPSSPVIIFPRCRSHQTLPLSPVVTPARCHPLQWSSLLLSPPVVTSVCCCYHLSSSPRGAIVTTCHLRILLLLPIVTFPRSPCVAIITNRHGHPCDVPSPWTPPCCEAQNLPHTHFSGFPRGFRAPARTLPDTPESNAQLRGRLI
jgi:hypothetical protein